MAKVIKQKVYRDKKGKFVTTKQVAKGKYASSDVVKIPVR